MKLNTNVSMRKPLKDKTPKQLIIHPLNEMAEFVHEHIKNIPLHQIWICLKGM